MYKRKRAGNTITRKINSTKDTAAKADKNHYISNSYLEGFIPIDTEYFTASLEITSSISIPSTRRATPCVFPEQPPIKRTFVSLLSIISNSISREQTPFVA